MFESVLNNTNFYFDESYSPQLLTPPLNLQVWCKIPFPSLITPSLHPTIELWRIKVFKTKVIKYKSSRLIHVFLKILTFRSYQKSIIRTIENSYKSIIYV